MSQYVMDENHEGVQVASNIGWSNFCEWVESTEMEDYPWLHHLARFGFANEPTELAEEVRSAIRRSPPDDDTEDVSEGLIEFLRSVPDAEIIIVNNGITSEHIIGEDE